MGGRTTDSTRTSCRARTTAGRSDASTATTAPSPQTGSCRFTIDRRRWRDRRRSSDGHCRGLYLNRTVQIETESALVSFHFFPFFFARDWSPHFRDYYILVWCQRHRGFVLRIPRTASTPSYGCIALCACDDLSYALASLLFFSTIQPPPLAPPTTVHRIHASSCPTSRGEIRHDLSEPPTDRSKTSSRTTILPKKKTQLSTLFRSSGSKRRSRTPRNQHITVTSGLSLLKQNKNILF
jgi:hypothetical protein